MSNISVLQAPGSGHVASAKTDIKTNPHPLTNLTPVSASVVPPGTTATFPSPRIEIDPQLNTVIIHYLNVGNGAQDYQIPSKSQLRLYHQHQTSSTSTAAVSNANAKPSGETA